MQRDFERHSEITSDRFDDLTRQYGGVLPLTRNQSKSSLRQVLTPLLKRLEDGLRFDHICLGLYDPESNAVSVIVQAGEHEFPSEISVVESSLGRVIHRAQAIEVADAGGETQFTDLVECARSGGFRSFRIVPLSTGRETFGPLCVVRKASGAFSAEDVRYLDHAAQLVALVLENSVMAEVLGREKAQLEVLLEVSKALVSCLDPRKILQAVSASIRRIVPYDSIHLALYDEASDSMKFHVLDPRAQSVSAAEHLVRVSECPSGVVFREGETRVFREADLRTMDSEYTRHLVKLGVRSVACFPLLSS